MALSLWDDEDLVASLGYSRELDRGTHGMRWVRPKSRPNQSMGLGLTGRRGIEHTEPRALRERLPQSVKTGRSKKLLPEEVLAIVQSPYSLSHLARLYGVTRPAIAYYRRVVRRGGQMAVECLRRRAINGRVDQ